VAIFAPPSRWSACHQRIKEFIRRATTVRLRPVEIGHGRRHRGLPFFERSAAGQRPAAHQAVYHPSHAAAIHHRRGWPRQATSIFGEGAALIGSSPTFPLPTDGRSRARSAASWSVLNVRESAVIEAAATPTNLCGAGGLSRGWLDKRCSRFGIESRLVARSAVWRLNQRAQSAIRKGQVTIAVVASTPGMKTPTSR